MQGNLQNILEINVAKPKDHNMEPAGLGNTRILTDDPQKLISSRLVLVQSHGHQFARSTSRSYIYTNLPIFLKNKRLGKLAASPRISGFLVALIDWVDLCRKKLLGLLVLLRHTFRHSKMNVAPYHHMLYFRTFHPAILNVFNFSKEERWLQLLEWRSRICVIYTEFDPKLNTFIQKSDFYGFKGKEGGGGVSGYLFHEKL